MNSLSLLSNDARVEIPYVKVTIGDYTFGVYQKLDAKSKDSDGFYQASKIQYPNYIRSLKINKVNGKVNTYTLTIAYPVTPQDDPNFFEKVFSSVSKSRKIVFSYGDMAFPTLIYRNEQAIITNVNSSFEIQNNVIIYTVNATSSASLLQSGNYTFINGTQKKKPSDEIKNLLYNKVYGLQNIFYGMNDKQLVEQKGLIASDDKPVRLITKSNISPLDYINYLVSCMIPNGYDNSNNLSKDIYILKIVDDVEQEFGGPYFQVVKSSRDVQNSDAYLLEIGYPTSTIVTDLKISNQENYSIYYDWQQELSQEAYSWRLDGKGNWEQVYAPTVSSSTDAHRTNASEKTWWTKITQYPISAKVTLKGLLRPAVLMTNVRLKVYFYGVKHINSGLYIVTAQEDSISESGYRTTLTLTRIASDDDETQGGTSK